MKLSIYGVLLYGIVVLLGGLIGYFQAGSIPSLVMGTAFGILLILSAVAMFKGKKAGRWVAIALSTLLVLFFSYRLLLTHNLMPAGIIILLGLWLIVRLLHRPS